MRALCSLYNHSPSLFLFLFLSHQTLNNPTSREFKSEGKSLALIESVQLLQGKVKRFMHRMEERLKDLFLQMTKANRYAFVKTIPYKKVTHGVPCSVIREVSILENLNHENIVRLLDVQADTKEVNLVFELLDCNLQALMETRVCRTPQAIKLFLYQILSGVSYCHSQEILHRNINPKNILVDRNKVVLKLANFRQSREVGVPRKAYSGKVGTLHYMAPELLFGCKEYSYPVDIWAVGCIFGQMVKGEKLFDGDTIADMLNNIFSVLGKPDEKTWPGVTKLYPCLHEMGTSSSQDLEKEVPDLHVYGLDLLDRMLCLDPSRRITADQALGHLYFRDL